MRLARALLQLIVATNDEPIQSSALRYLGGARCRNCDDLVHASAGMDISSRDTAGDSGRSPQCLHLAETILLDHGPRRRLQSFETARRGLLPTRTNSGRRAWRNRLRTHPPQATRCRVSLDLSHFRIAAFSSQRDFLVAGARDLLRGV